MACIMSSSTGTSSWPAAIFVLLRTLGMPVRFGPSRGALGWKNGSILEVFGRVFRDAIGSVGVYTPQSRCVSTARIDWRSVCVVKLVTRV
jgi:hypothetical protein